MAVGAGLCMYDVVVKKFTFAISSLDKFLVTSLMLASVGISCSRMSVCLSVCHKSVYY